jgi:hypothetical protein
VTGSEGQRPRRRARGEGSIFRRASDGRWVVRFDLGYVQGRRKRITRYAATEREALEELRRLRREFDAGRLVVGAGGQMTVEQYLDYWMTELLPGTVKASTEASYIDMTRRHLVPGLGHLSLGKLSRDDVRRFFRQLARKKSQRRGEDRSLSPRTVQYVHSILRRALDDARREELVGRNVAREVSPPRFERRDFAPLSSAEARVLLAAAADDRLHGVYVLALVLGMRRGEVLGLRWVGCRPRRWLVAGAVVVTAGRGSAGALVAQDAAVAAGDPAPSGCREGCCGRIVRARPMSGRPPRCGALTIWCSRPGSGRRSSLGT